MRNQSPYRNEDPLRTELKEVKEENEKLRARLKQVSRYVDSCPDCDGQGYVVDLGRIGISYPTCKICNGEGTVGWEAMRGKKRSVRFYQAAMWLSLSLASFMTVLACALANISAKGAPNSCREAPNGRLVVTRVELTGSLTEKVLTPPRKGLRLAHGIVHYTSMGEPSVSLTLIWEPSDPWGGKQLGWDEPER